MFSQLTPQPPDALLGVLAAFNADTAPGKIDLGVGVYRDASGVTPVMAAVRKAESEVLARQSTKAYVGAGGNRPFAAFIEELTLGSSHPARTAGRLATLQTPGGCGALRLAAELIVRIERASRVSVSDPTWPNHVPLISGAGLPFEVYPYYDAASGTISFEAMLATLERLPAGSVVLLQASCHNPTGADLDEAQWRTLAALLARKGLMPLIDLAYQGLGDGLDRDAFAVRLLAEQLPELLVAISCSKNFGLYRERVGAVMALAPTAAAATVVMGHLQSLARRMYSMPPDHGAAIVATIAATPALKTEWLAELNAMRARVIGLREPLAAALRQTTGSNRFDFVGRQRGMFSLLGLDATQVAALKERHHVYVAPDSRMNVAGLAESQIERLAEALGAVVR